MSEIEIPSCTRVLDSAFSGCVSLQEITLPDQTIIIGSNLFENCTSLRKVTILSGTVLQDTFAKSPTIEEIVLGENVTSVAQYAFKSCTGLKYLTIPSINTTTSFNQYYFGITPLSYTYSGTGSDSLYPDKVKYHTVSGGVFALPADDSKWYYDGNRIAVNGVYYTYDGKPVTVSQYQRCYETLVGIYYQKPKTWTATFYYTPDNSLQKLTITNQLISKNHEVLKNCTCEIDIRQKFPVKSVSLIGESELYLDELDLNCYTIRVEHTDGFVETLPFLTEYLQSDLNELKTAGTKTVSFSYGGVSGEFTIVLKLRVFENVTMEDLITVCDDTPKSLIVVGAPEGTTITYENNGQISAGQYTVTAVLTNPYYETTTLTATLTIRQKTYSITYVLNNAKAVNNNPSVYNCGKNMTIGIPFSTTAVFEGWYIDEALTEKFGKITAETYGDIVLYAKWLPNFTVSGNSVTGLTDAGKQIKVIEIPERIDDTQITSIAAGAFRNCSWIIDIFLPDSITSIGTSAFEGCTGLTSIKIPDEVTAIGTSAFSGCTGLTDVIFGNGVATIESSAFERCTGLTSIEIPGSVTSIGKSAFGGCTGLVQIKLPFVGATLNGNENTHFGWIFGATSYSDASCVPESLEKVIISSKTGNKAIGAYAFYHCSALKSVILPDGITSIGTSAFEGCTGFTSIEIPGSVTSIGKSAFGGCTGLAQIKLPFVGATLNGNENTHFGWIFGATSYSDASCVPESLEKVTISSNTGNKAIGADAFYHCSALKSVTIPGSVTLIGADAFDGCSTLTNIYITDIAAWCNIKRLYDLMECNNNSKNLYLDGVLITDLVIPDGVTEISRAAFRGCANLTSVTIPDSVTKIGADAFVGCSILTNIYITDVATWCNIEGLYSLMRHENNNKNLYLDDVLVIDLVIPNGVTAICSDAFYHCSALKSVTIPDSVTEIGYCVFGGCSALTNIYMTDVAAWCNIKGLYDLMECNNNSKNLYLDGVLITDFVIPDDVTEISRSAFRGCTSIISITISDCVTSIGHYAFQGCTNLTSVTIPDSVTEIGTYAFDGCSALTNIYITDVAAWCNIDGLYNLMYCSKSSKYFYVNKTLVNNLVIPDGVTTIKGFAFARCDCLSSIIIPDSLISLGEDPFYNCRGLSYNYYNGGRYLGNANNPYIILKNGRQATDIHPDTKFIDSSAFDTWYTGTTVTIPGKVTYIGDYAFRGCSKLTSITISDSVTCIGNYAFNGCSNLQKIYYNGTKAQWEAISKGYAWDSDTGNYIVYCTDGNIEK